MIKNIIFDFGGVILKHRSTLMEEKISAIFSISKEQALKIWTQWKTKLLTGQVSSEQFLKGVKIELKSDKTLPQILKEWKDIYIREAEDVDWELLEFIEKLKYKYNVYLFADTIDTHDEYNSTRGIYDKFTQVFKSNEEGLTKLNDNAFINVLNKIHTKGDACIFIDDLEANINKAKSLKIKGIIYKNKDQLQQDLSKLGIFVIS